MSRNKYLTFCLEATRIRCWRLEALETELFWIFNSLIVHTAPLFLYEQLWAAALIYLKWISAPAKIPQAINRFPFQPEDVLTPQMLVKDKSRK